MTISKKTTFTKAEFLTPDKFAKKYGIPKGLVESAVMSLYKKNKEIKTQHNNLTPVIIRNRATHSTSARYLIFPLAHEIVLKEIESQKNLLLKQQKGNEK